MTHPADLPIRDAGLALRDGALTAVALTQAHLSRIADRDGMIGAFVHLDSLGALAAAQAADAAFGRGENAGPLQGIPVAIKDVIDVAGWPVRHGSRQFANRIATTDAPVITRLRNAGAVLIGLAASYELAVVGPGADGLYPQPRNPWNSDHITGGSSSGCAAAIAAGLVRVAVGTDTGGSVRSPAAYCGIVGLKPSFGQVQGDDPFAPSLDHLGPLARSVADATMLYTTMSGRQITPAPDIAGLRVGVARTWCGGDADPEIAPALDGAASTLSLCGARVQVVDLPDYAVMEAAAAVIVHAEGFRWHRSLMQGDGGAMGRMTYQSMASGAGLTPQDEANAHRAADLLRAQVDLLLDQVDVILTPTTVTTAPTFSAFEGGQAAWTPMRTIPFNLTGHPALSVPMGFARGLPLGMQIIGRHGEEATVLAVGAAFEAATDHAVPSPFSTVESLSDLNCEGTHAA